MKKEVEVAIIGAGSAGLYALLLNCTKKLGKKREGILELPYLI